jgi:polyisoprenoid-binding protein YceI
MTMTTIYTDHALANTELTGNYVLDAAHSRIGFSARHAMVTKVRGAFNEVEGSGYFDPEDLSKSHAELTIKVASIDTRNETRDNHLRTNDFLAMDEYPEITFRSTAVEKAGEANYRVTGELTIRGTTKPVSIDFEYTGSAVDPWGNVKLGFEGQTTINRKDWGVNWNVALEKGGVLVSDKVTLEFELALQKAAA